MSGKVLRFADYDRRDPDSVSPRDPADSAVIIILPVVRIERLTPVAGRRNLKKKESR